MKSRIQRAWDSQPLTLVLILAIFFRLLAVFFAKGWGMLDDHFLIIESAQSWVDGFDYNYWLPWTPENNGPTGHLLFYPGIHYLLFSFFKWIGIDDPQVKMYIVRFLHAAFSLLIVYYGYLIVEKLDGMKTARLAGLLLAIFWFMPWLSVRNLAEMFCIPFVLAGFWQILKEGNNQRPLLRHFIAGLFFGLAFAVRPQIALLASGVGVVMLIQKQWRELGVLILGSVTAVLMTLGAIDYYLWGIPLVELYGYFFVCTTESGNYVSLPWYNYFLVIWGILIPPVSLFLFFGFLRGWKKYLILFLPATLFFIFHSYFPNKQERFILPFIPFFIMLGVIGWQHFINQSRFWKEHRKLLWSSWIFFWTINLILLSGITLTYSKRARVESMRYLSKYQDIGQVLVVDAFDSPEMFPLFYLNQWIAVYDEFLPEATNTEALIRYTAKQQAEKQPRFILFSGKENLRSRVIRTRESFPFIVYETKIEPGMIDNVLHWLNPPFNHNKTVYIYRNTQFIPQRLE